MKPPVGHHRAKDRFESNGDFHTLVESVADAAGADLTIGELKERGTFKEIRQLQPDD